MFFLNVVYEVLEILLLMDLTVMKLWRAFVVFFFFSVPVTSRQSGESGSICLAAACFLFFLYLDFFLIILNVKSCVLVVKYFWFRLFKQLLVF